MAFNNSQQMLPSSRLVYRLAGNATVPTLPSATGTGHVQSSPTAAEPPYAPEAASLGNPPSEMPDVPATVVFLVLFLAVGILNIRLFISNRKNDHKFMFSMASFSLLFHVFYLYM